MAELVRGLLVVGFSGAWKCDYKDKLMGDNYTAYKNYIRCLGNLCGTCCCNYKRIETSTIGLMEEFGKFKELLEPGLHYYNPCT